MANDKKEFKIVINGVQESCDAVKALNKELSELDGKLKILQNAKINIKVQGNTEKKEVVSSGKSNTDNSQTQQQQALAKLQQQLAQQKAKAEALVTDEYKKQYQELLKVKAELKEQETIQKQIADGVRVQNGGYADTLQGQRAYLSELQKTFNSQKMGTEEWKKTADELLRVREFVKSIEQSTGDFRRNVGNYPSGAKELVVLFKETKENIDNSTKAINDLKNAMSNMNVGSDAYKDAAVKLAELTDELEKATKAKEELDQELGKKVSIDVGGELQYFDDLEQAAEGLKKQLQILYQEGEVGSKKWDATIKALGRVRTAVTAVDNEVTSFIGNSKGLQDTITIMNGLTSIASLGTGLMGLFGGQNEQLDETMKKFVSLTLVMNGLSQIQKQMNDQTDIFGQKFSQAWDIANKSVTKVLNAFTGGYFGKAMSNMDSLLKLTDEYGFSLDGVLRKAQQLGNALTESIGKAGSTAQSAYGRLLGELTNARPNQPVFTEEDWVELFSLDSIGELGNKYGQGLQDAMDDLKQALEDGGINVEEFQKQSEQLGKSLEILNGSSGKLTKTLLSSGKAGQIAARGIAMVTKSIKALAASTVILLAVQVAMEAIMWIFEKIGEGVDKLTGKTDKLEKGWVDFEARANSVAESLRILNDEISREETKGKKTSLEANIERAENLSKALEDAKNRMLEFTKAGEEINFDQDWSDAWFNDHNIKNMEEFKKQYDILVKAVAKGQDELEAAGKDKSIGGWLKSAFVLSADDARTDLAMFQETILKQMQYDINQINWDKPEEAYKKFMSIINDETNASALSNIDNIFKDDAWQQGLKVWIEQYKNFAEQLNNINATIVAQQTQLSKQIANNNAQAISDSYQRQKKLNELALQDELDAAGSNEELKESIRKKYQRIQADNEKAHNKQMESDRKAARQKALQNRITAIQSEIDLMDEGLEKQKAILELEKKQAVDSAKEQGASKKTIMNIVESYNRKIVELEKQYVKDLEKLYKDRNRTLVDLELQYLAEVKNVERSIWDRQMEIKQQVEEFNQAKYEFHLDFNIRENPPINEYVDNLVDYYNRLLESQKQYVEKKKQLDKETENENYNREQDDYYTQYKERGQFYSDWLSNQNDMLEESLKSGIITQTQYDEMRKENQVKADQYLADERQKYIDNLEQSEKDHNNRMQQIEWNAQQEIANLVKSHFNEQINTYKEYYSELEQLTEENTKRNTSQIGIINFKKEKENLKNSKEAYEQMFRDIEEEYKKLQQSFDNNEISFNDFRLAKKELDSLANDVKDKVAKTDQDLKKLFTTVMQSVMQSTQQYVQAFSSIWSSIFSLMQMSLDNEERRLEREQEILDEEYDMLQEQYEKQEELEKRHTDKINDIEGELKNARGDRRQHLIDQLTQEREAQIKALNNEREIEKEKERNQKKQEQLEKQQAALEKKRWEQNKKNQIVQATINTFTAVSNALAVQPWFVGLALSAVALGLGMANVAKIKAQKYYAKGGLLEGKPHSQGGIKVGNTGIEVEGGEFVTNKYTTRQNLPLLEYINSKKKPITREDLISFYDDGKNKLINKSIFNKFAEGGRLPVMQDIDVRDLVNYTPQTDDRPIYVSVTEIENVMENVKHVRALAGAN